MGEEFVVVVHLKWIGGLDFEAAETVVAHDGHFSFQFWLGDGGAEPPPADHRSCISRGLVEGVAELIDVGLGDRLGFWLSGSAGGAAGEEKGEQREEKKGAGGWCHGGRLAGRSAWGYLQKNCFE